MRKYVHKVVVTLIGSCVICTACTNSNDHQKHLRSSSAKPDAMLSIQTPTDTSNHADVECWSHIDGGVVIRVSNTSDMDIALIPTMYAVNELRGGISRTTSQSIGTVVYWDSTDRHSPPFELLEPWPRYRSGIAVQVVAVRSRNSVTIYFPLEQAIEKDKSNRSVNIILDAVPYWVLNEDFNQLVTPNCFAPEESRLDMCHTDDSSFVTGYQICNVESSRLDSRKAYNKLVKTVRHATTEK